VRSLNASKGVMSDIFVFQVEHGGLGDHLFFTPLPRLLKERGLAGKVFISSASPFRNQHIYDFVWASNPYLDGISDAPVTLTPQVPAEINKVINQIMAKHGIVDIYDELNPELYLEVDENIQYAGKSYLDLNYISYVGAFSLIDKLMLARLHPDCILINPGLILKHFVNNETIKISCLGEYASLIKSAGFFGCLTSGGATLAAALRKSSYVFFGHGHPSFLRHSLHRDVRVGGAGVFRKILAIFYSQKNVIRSKISVRK